MFFNNLPKTGEGKSGGEVERRAQWALPLVTEVYPDTPKFFPDR